MHSCVKALHLADGNIDSDESELEMLNAADDDDRTALHLACLNGHFQIVTYLCISGANLEARYVSHYLKLACATTYICIYTHSYMYILYICLI